jgi:calcineurin-like phosphoesterase family protein
MRIKVKDKERVWIFSDPHYNHKNICRGTTNWRMPDGSIPEKQTRDFKDLERMNAAIVDNINDCAGQGDILICLGDWSFGGYESIAEFWNRLICKNIYLILGNHDHHIENDREGCQNYFKKVGHYATLEIEDGHKFRLMHYPIVSWDGLRKGVVHLHGHCHLPTEKRFGEGKRMDVGMDGHPEFRPYDLRREILPMMAKRPVGSELGSDDHHTDDLKGVIG